MIEKLLRPKKNQGTIWLWKTFNDWAALNNSLTKHCIQKAALNTSLGCQCVNLFFSFLKYHKIFCKKKCDNIFWQKFSFVTIWVFEFPYNFDFVTILVFEFGHFLSCVPTYFGFVTMSFVTIWVLSSVTTWVLNLVTFQVFEYCHIWVLSCHNLSFWVLSQFDQIEILSFNTIWVFEIHHILIYWVLLQFEFLSFVTNWIF